MKVRIESNFVIPGLEGDSLAIDEASTVRQVLKSVSRLSEERCLFLAPGQDDLDPDDWEVDLNGIPCGAYTAGLETPLMAGDLVAIRLLMVSGG
jgi:hypothetical protein